MATQHGIKRHPGLMQESELWEWRQDPSARAELVQRFLPFAKSVALRYSGRAESLDDLIQVANLGLMKSIDRFDPDKGHAFMAYASSTINGELKRHFRDRVSTVRLPRSLYERIGEVDSVASDLRNSLRREPTLSEIAAYIGCAEAEVSDALAAAQARNPTTLQFESEDEDGGQLEEHLGAEDEAFRRAEDAMTVSGALEDLDDSDQTLIRMRFSDELPQREIGEKLGCSQMQVSRRLRRLLDDLNREVAGAV